MMLETTAITITIAAKIVTTPAIKSVPGVYNLKFYII